MKLFRMIKNGIRDAFKSVIRNFSLSLASISCISITLIVVALALLVAFNVENFSNKVGDNVTIGGGSVVTKDIPANSTAVGSPSRVINEKNPGRYIKNPYQPAED